MLTTRRSIPVSDQLNKHCCPMKEKVILGIAKVLSEEECGIPDSALVDYHDFEYESPTKLPISAALTTRFCSWCGAEKNLDDKRRITEVIRSHH